MTAMIGYRFVFGRGRPLFEPAFNLPASRRIDAPLVLGAATFGLGWGIAGFCPGGSIPALALGFGEPFIFVAAMLVGIAAVRAMRAMRAEASRAVA